MRTLVTMSVLLMTLAIAGCGGGGAGAPADPAVAATDAAVASNDPAVAATDPAGAASEVAPVASPASQSAGGGGTGGFASRPCDLVSPADAEAAAGTGGLTPTVLQVDPTSGICSYHNASMGIEVYAGVWERAAAEQQWATMEYLVDAGTPDIEKVEGLGGDAIYSTSGSVLLVRKDDTLVQLTIRNPDLDAAANKAAVLALGKAVLGRM